MKAAGKPLTSMVLADGLIRYSERGQEYVDTLKGIIRVNGIEIADEVFRVWARQHPNVLLVPTGMSDPIAFMIERAIRAGQ